MTPSGADNRANQPESHAMSMKKTDLVKNLAKKLDGRMKTAGVPGRFAQGAAEMVDKREQRRRDAEAGLVPFACKLPSGLVKRLHERAAGVEAGVNGLVAQALGGWLDSHKP
jgi:hypothetical protein